MNDRVKVTMRAAFALSLLLFALARALKSHSPTLGSGDFSTADWLINYAGGFVRRGLFGELFLAVAPIGAPGLWLLFAFRAGCYVPILLYIVQFLHRSQYSWSSIVLACGPAALPFIAWDPPGAFRKEILTFVVLVVLAWARSSGPGRRQVVVLLATALTLFAVAVLSWEPSAFMLPAAVYILCGDSPDRPFYTIRRVAAMLFIAVATLGLGASMLARGDVGTAERVCEAVRAHGFDCGGAIDAIGWSSDTALQKLRAKFPLYLGYLPLIALALLPVAASRWFRLNWKWAAACAISILPLYFVAHDYGRWTHILVMQLTFCIMAGAPRDSDSSVWTPLAALSYVALWAMPHYLPASADGWPYLGLLPTALHYARSLLRLLPAVS
jgi:hypothetical protein